MCGFLAIDSKEFDLKTFDEALAKCQDRGPDMTRVFDERGVTFGFNRLAIMDLTDSGMQPFETLDCTLVCNEEIYNYPELKKNLETDYEFTSSSDCEVLIPLYRKYGIETMVKMLDGEFFPLSSMITSQRRFTRPETSSVSGQCSTALQKKTARLPLPQLARNCLTSAAKSTPSCLATTMTGKRSWPTMKQTSPPR